MKKFNRVVIKISGEALAGEKKTGFDFDLISTVCQVLKKASEQGTSRMGPARLSASTLTVWACSPPA